MTGRRNMIYGGGGAPDQGTPASHTIIPSSSITTEPLFLSTSSSSPSFLGSRSMVSFEDVNGRKRQERPFFGSFDDDNNNNGEEEYDEYFNQPEKKRRLTADQVQFLEKSFEVENKLEPERKVQLAKDLGLQPRQVAIWFQNRRARWKTKQMEKDYDVLQSSYNRLKADYEGLIKEKEKLNAEVLHLKEKLLLQQNEKTDSDISDTIPPKSPSSGRADESASEGDISKNLSESNKIEQTCSTKSDSLDSDSPRYADGGHSYVDQSELSQDEEDNLSNTCVLAPPLYTYPKMENYDFQDPSTYSCLYEFAAEDQHIDFWSY